MPQDAKYGRVTLEHGAHVPDDEPVVVFRARDKLVPVLLRIYASLCAEAGSPEYHLVLTARAADRIESWQAIHADEVRVPTSETFLPREDAHAE